MKLSILAVCAYCGSAKIGDKPHLESQANFGPDEQRQGALYARRLIEASLDPWLQSAPKARSPTSTRRPPK